MQKPKTTKIVLTITEELNEALNNEVRRRFGGMKGAKSLLVESILRNHLKVKSEVEF
ncbi:MAG: hypothetical protein QXW83_04460 [Nitrososphaerales archaeon]